MAAVSAPQAPSVLPPTSSTHEAQDTWNYSVPAQKEVSLSQTHESQSNTHVHALNQQVGQPNILQRRIDTINSTRPAETGLMPPTRINAPLRKDGCISDAGNSADSLLDFYGPNRSGMDSFDYVERKGSTVSTFEDEEDPEHSRWIHRDKLARIESQELQAAGIFLHQPRAPIKPSGRRDNIRDQQVSGLLSEPNHKRYRKDSLPPEEAEAPENNSWDLRLPEEAEYDMYQDVSGGVKGISRIPVCKRSPLPIPMVHLERDTPLKRRKSAQWNSEEDSISYDLPRQRSSSMKEAVVASSLQNPTKKSVPENLTPKKQTARKTSASSGRSPGNRQTRSESNSRPQTRSGETGQASNKRPEGDPPWLATMYKPDPRLPPDQQLLPTVAKRLQQEKWAKEGKFGNTYDTSFRPLNDEEFSSPPESQSNESEKEKPDDNRLGSQWPLRNNRNSTLSNIPKSPTLSTGRPGTAGGYSTMPKITSAQTSSPYSNAPLNAKATVQTQEVSKEEKSKGRFACCAVM